ncbi:hypothetical protein ACJJV6_01655 [Arthrobacter nitrophenolicus]|uniref:hypothetical protein n=1 Tax=Arthrobacter nitrophenolicus TaxID=683150 RepID=UPI003899C62D
MDKQRFLICYDYGVGGLWAFIYARSSEEILGKYPELYVASSGRDGWMGTKWPGSNQWSHDIEGEPFGVLRVVTEERSHD